MSERKKLPRIMICGTGSGCGKTAVVMALCSVLVRRNLDVKPYKCGPDYIDAMYHSRITKNSAANLDLYFCNKQELVSLMCSSAKNADIAVIEGVMGFYDGIGNTSQASSYEISEATQTPVILVVNPEGMARSAAALVRGYLSLEENQIAGVIFNGIKPGIYSFYKNITEKETGVEVFGYIPHIKDIELESRHLGLMTASEISEFDKKINILAETAAKTLDIEKIIRTAENTAELSYNMPDIPCGEKFTLAVAKDKAFCFYYSENLELFEKLGADIEYFSPLDDKELPCNADGIYLGGGYPEIYAEKLSSNRDMIDSLRNYIGKDMPVLAECGGFMYLLDEITDKSGRSFKTAGIISGKAFMTDKLCRFGYVDIIADRNSFIAKKGSIIKGHEFHYSDSTANGDGFIIRRPNGKQWSGINISDNIIAGYPHMYFYSNISFAETFAEKCRNYSREKLCL